MTSVHRFDRFVRRFLSEKAREPFARIDVAMLADELSRYDAEVQTRLRRAALRAIEDELARIRAERHG